MQMPPEAGKVTALARWLEALRLVTPPRALVHVGAGRTNPSAFSPLHAIYGNVPSVIALEADAARAAQLQAVFASNPQVQVRHALVAPKAGPATLRHASIPEESGLCTPEQLHAVWPRLQALQEEEFEAVGMADCWKAPGAAAAPGMTTPNWLFVDCLPATELLQEIPELLASADVVVARAVDPARLAITPGNSLERVGLAALQKLLVKQRLQLLGVEEENHPAVVLAVFARDQSQRVVQQRSETERIQAELADAGSVREKLVQEIAVLKSDAAELKKEKAASQRELEELRRSRAAAEKLVDDRGGALQRLQQEWTASQKAMKERELELQQELVAAQNAMKERQLQLQQELTAAQNAMKERQLKLQQELTASQKSLEERQMELQQARRAVEEQTRLAAQRQQQIEQLTRGRAELSQQVTDLRSRLDEVGKREEVLAQEVREARQTAALSVRLQSLREADLKDLQARYQTAAEVQERQHQLLLKLGERLRVASSYLHQLTTSGTEAALAGNGSGAAAARKKPQRRVSATQAQAQVNTPSPGTGKDVAS